MYSVARALVVKTILVSPDWLFVLSSRGDLSWRVKRAEWALRSLHSPWKVAPRIHNKCACYTIHTVTRAKVESHIQKPVKQIQLTDNSNIAWLTEGWYPQASQAGDRKSTRLNSSHQIISYAVFCLKKKTHNKRKNRQKLLPNNPHTNKYRI